jgi:hypothetical protein
LRFGDKKCLKDILKPPHPHSQYLFSESQLLHEEGTREFQRKMPGLSTKHILSSRRGPGRGRKQELTKFKVSK